MKEKNILRIIVVGAVIIILGSNIYSNYEAAHVTVSGLFFVCNKLEKKIMKILKSKNNVTPLNSDNELLIISLTASQGLIILPPVIPPPLRPKGSARGRARLC